ncbi:hypothetical protein [uncultured Victivallis sp.]|uniref:hypothetical protein n=1 Tax=uncultured Victivallis sp. TaxID=354118 RepID=UPI0025CF7634|nr:hypothetical protein [uncultured Victivallis sp.]
MADQEPKTENPGINEDDTRTRKTVRLKSPSVTPSSIKLPAAAPITDPMTGRDTDTGNLDVLADTQTRRTVKLKPLAPQKAANTPIKLQGAGVTTTTTVTPIPASGMDTQTRKTVVLKPAAPAGIQLDGANTQTRKTVVLRPSVAPASGLHVTPSAPAVDAEDTTTRKTVALHPSTAAPSGLKITPAPAAAAAGEEDDTRTRKTVVLKPSAATPAGLKIEKEDMDDATIRIQRPPHKTPATPAAAPAAPAAQKQTVELSAEALVPEEGAPRQTVELPAEALVPENEIQKTMELDTSDLVDEKATVKLAPPKHPVPPPVPPVKKTGKVETEEPEKAPETEGAEAPAEETAAAPAEEAAAAGKKQKKVKAPRPAYSADVRRPSAAYLVMAVITLILMVGTATLTTVQYLNLCQNQNIELPGLGK